MYYAREQRASSEMMIRRLSVFPPRLPRAFPSLSSPTEYTPAAIAVYKCIHSPGRLQFVTTSTYIAARRFSSPSVSAAVLSSVRTKCDANYFPAHRLDEDIERHVIQPFANLPESVTNLVILSTDAFYRGEGPAFSFGIMKGTNLFLWVSGAATATTGVIRCDQPRTLDLGARQGRRLETVPAAVLDEVLAKLATILE
jgi:mRNA-degrading endonuclease toxin of MazEF toxin-antitoxin module